MKDNALFYWVFNNFFQHMPNQNFYLYIFFSIIKSFIILSLKQINFGVQAMAKQNYQATAFFTIIQYGYETFQNVKPALLNHIAKTPNLELNLLLISNKDPNLHSVICSEMSNASVIHILNITVKWKG